MQDAPYYVIHNAHSNHYTIVEDATRMPIKVVRPATDWALEEAEWERCSKVTTDFAGNRFFDVKKV
jgi:hypothetical protein